MDGRYEENKKADIVREIFAWAAQGHGGVWIAHRLNERRRKSPDAAPVLKRIGPKWQKRIDEERAPAWHPNVIRALLRDCRVLGYLKPCIRVDGKRVPVPGPEAKIYPAVVGEELFAQIQRLDANPYPLAARIAARSIW